jgi:hypothetical protein
MSISNHLSTNAGRMPIAIPINTLIGSTFNADMSVEVFSVEIYKRPVSPERSFIYLRDEQTPILRDTIKLTFC